MSNTCFGEKHSALRAQLRAFHPDECHERCKDPAYAASEKAINADLDAYAAAHPRYDALDLRQACYLSMRKHFAPFLFTESPFYFEAGVNGGWIMEKAPARGVNRLCSKFYKEMALVPDEEFRGQLKHFLWQWGSISNYWNQPVGLGGTKPDVK
ncbi:MAG: hypothetical protein ILM98_00185 [Kiritimatiellae bacterium]|nr:hypothetical protein [Kiritimatiellia bacterium]